MNYKQLTFAREYRGYSQTELSNFIQGLSQSNLSKFEKGIGVLSEDLQHRIMEFLDFPIEFFNRKISTTIENGNYRKRSAVTKTEILHFETNCKLIGYMIDEFSTTVDWPEFKLFPLNVEDGYTPQKIAQFNRSQLGLNRDEPVRNIIGLLESKGVIVYEIDVIEKFDGVSFVTTSGFPLIIINKNFPNDRKRYTIAHELGHLLMHNENNFPVSDNRDKEMEANIFAAEFLMPEAEIKHSLRNLKMSDLAALKQIWLTSMSSIIRRAKDLGCITPDRYKFFSIEMSRYGYSRREPHEVAIDNPACFKNACKLLQNELSYSKHDFSRFFALPNNIIEKFIFPTTNDVKLKVLKMSF